jgi:predicted nucleotidyltransferase
MLLETNIGRIMEVFMKRPTSGLQLREIVRATKLGNPTVSRGLKKLSSLNLIKRIKGKVYPYYVAKLDESDYKALKLSFTLSLVFKLSEIISKKSRPNVIVLFGSGSKGTDTEVSDIDLFIQSKMHKFEVEKFEKKLNRKISLIFEPDLKKLSKELINNLSNGYVVYGYLEAIS